MAAIVYKIVLSSNNLAVDHVGDHHDLIDGRIGKLQRQFGGFDIEGENDRIWMDEEVFSQSQSRRTPTTGRGFDQKGAAR